MLASTRIPSMMILSCLLLMLGLATSSHAAHSTAATTTSENVRSLRGQPTTLHAKNYNQNFDNLQSYNHNNDRLLQQQQQEFTTLLNFTLLWRLEIDTASVEDRQPTVREYDGIVEATGEWMAETIIKIYPEFVTLELLETEFLSGSWDDPSAIPQLEVSREGDNSTHLVSMQVEVTLSALNATDLPPLSEFLLAMNAFLNVPQFVSDYLPQSGGSDGLFQHAVAATFSTLGDVEEENEYSEEVTAAPTPVYLFNRTFAMPFNMKWNLKVDEDNEFIEDRLATDEEAQAIVDATENWLRLSIDKVFMQPMYMTGNISYEFRNVATTLRGDPTWFPGEPYPHEISVAAMILWNAPDMSHVPTTSQFIGSMSQFDLLDFLQPLKRSEPVTSVFRRTTDASYSTLAADPIIEVQIKDSDDSSAAEGDSDSDTDATTSDNNNNNNDGDTNSMTIAMGLQFGISASAAESLLQTRSSLEPTDAEWDGLLASITNFLDTQLEAYFVNAPSFQYRGATVDWLLKEYQPEQARRAYVSRIRIQIEFGKGSVVGSEQDYIFLIGGMFYGQNGPGLLDVVRNVEPTDSIFQKVSTMAWDF